MTKYGASPWLDQYPKPRVPAFPAYRGAAVADVVVVGGGLTGCATAYGLASAGLTTVLLEGARIGRGATAFSSGWIADDAGAGFFGLEQALGLRRARLAWQSWRRAALDFAALLRRLDIKCHLEPRPSLTMATTGDQMARLKKEHKARVGAGIEAPLLSARAIKAEAALDAAVGLRGRDGAILDPYRACIGLALAARKRGAHLFERSPVRRISFTRRHADVHTSSGAIRTHRIVVATGIPTPLFKSLARHFWFRSRYLVQTEAVPARVRHQLGQRMSIVRDSVEPPHVLRWMGEDRLLIAGADGETPPSHRRGAGSDKVPDRTIVQRTGQLMYELSTLYPDVSGLQPAYGWTEDYSRTSDGLPYIGAHRNFPHHLFALGDASHGVTGAYLASRILVRCCSGQAEPADEVFGFHRGTEPLRSHS